MGSPWETLVTKPLQRDAIYLKRHFDAEITVYALVHHVQVELQRSGRDLSQ